MNFLISSRAMINCGKITVNRSVYIFSSKPCANYCHFVNTVSKSRLGNFKNFTLNQIAVAGKRMTSKNTAAPMPSYKIKDHAHVWLWERIIAVGLLGVIPFLTDGSSNQVAEYVAAIFVTAHVHWGLEAICTDYLRPTVVGTFIPKCIPIIVLIPLVFAFYGIVNSTVSERGIVHILKQFWYLKTTEQLKNEQST